MQARYVNDTARGQGYGCFVIEGAALSLEGLYTFSVQRAGDGKNLGAVGWQDAEERLKPDAVRQEGATLYFSVSPLVVNHLDELETYRLNLQAQGQGPQRAVLELSTIIYADMAASNGLAQPAPKPVPVPAPTAAPVVQPAPPAEPEPDPGPERLVIVENAPPKKNPLPVVLLGLVLLAAALAAGWWFLLRDKPVDPVQTPATQQTPEPAKPAEPKPEQPKAEEPKKDEAKPAPATPAPATPAPAAEPAQSPKERVHAFVRKGGTPAEALALSDSLPKDTPEGQDARFLLLEMAAEGGDPTAMVGVARYYDPSDATPSGSIGKDMEQAWLWYAKALKAGAADARAGLDRLIAWLEAQATKASSATAETAKQAQDLLKRIKQAE